MLNSLGIVEVLINEDGSLHEFMFYLLVFGILRINWYSIEFIWISWHTHGIFAIPLRNLKLLNITRHSLD